MIEVTFDSETRARVRFSGEVAHGVTYKGSYHAVKEDGFGWRGRFDGPHRPADFPRCAYYALTADRENSKIWPCAPLSTAARRTLSARCLMAVMEAAHENPHLLVAAELQSLKDAVERLEENYQEHKKEGERLFGLLTDAAQKLHNFQIANGLKSEAS